MNLNNLDILTRFSLYENQPETLPKINKAYVQIPVRVFSEESTSIIESLMKVTIIIQFIL